MWKCEQQTIKGKTGRDLVMGNVLERANKNYKERWKLQDMGLENRESGKTERKGSDNSGKLEMWKWDVATGKKRAVRLYENIILCSRPEGYSNVSWVWMCGPKFRPPPYSTWYIRFFVQGTLIAITSFMCYVIWSFVKLDYLVGYALLMIRAAYMMDQRG